MKEERAIFKSLLCLVLAAYTQIYTPKYDSNGHLSLSTGELSGSGNISMVDNHEIGLFSYATNGGIIGVEDWYC